MKSAFVTFLVSVCCTVVFGQQRAIVSAVPILTHGVDVGSFPADQSIFLSASTNEYIVVVRASDGHIDRVVHAPIHNATSPLISASVSRDADGLFHYRYTLSNGSGARQAVERWAIAIDEVGHRVSLAHPSWNPSRASTPLSGISRDLHEVFQWESPAESALGPGQTASGFEIVSDLAPGYVLSAIYGKVADNELTEADWAALPQPVATQLRTLLGTAWDSQPRQIVGPGFPLNTPADVVQANFLFGLRDMKARNAIAKDSVVAGELEAVLIGALNQTGAAPVTPRIDALKLAPGSKEAEFVEALKLTLNSTGAR